jgi:energy-converting hydrogenase Eha subunit C
MGETPKRYFFLLLLSLIGLCVLAYVLVALPTPLDGLPYAALAKFGIVLAMLPMFWLWVARAMPRGVPLDAIPERALPPEKGA